MSVKILIDMNLSPQWVDVLGKNGIEAVHWSSIGDPKTKDHFIMEWARRNKHVVFTHDLDFGAMLALTQAVGPSVIQVRTQNVLPEHFGTAVVAVIKQYHVQLERGALIVLDDIIHRVRILPLTRP